MKVDCLDKAMEYYLGCYYFSDEIDSKIDKQFRYLATRIRAIERNTIEEKTQPAVFEDEVS